MTQPVNGKINKPSDVSFHRTVSLFYDFFTKSFYEILLHIFTDFFMQFCRGRADAEALS